MRHIADLTLLSALVSAAAVTDLRRRRIPNRLVVVGLVFAVVLQLSVYGPRGLSEGILGALLGLVCLLPFYALRAMGAGDVKLMSVIGIVMGPRGLLYAVALSLIAGGLFAMAYLAWRMLRESFRSFWQDGVTAGAVTAYIAARTARRDRLPFAVPIAVGSLAAFWVQSMSATELATWL
jgi:prepilin peptidase CpaA